MMQPRPERTVAHLIVILDTEHHAVQRHSGGFGSPGCTEIRRVLPGVEPALMHCGGEIRDRPGEILIVAITVTGRQPTDLVMEIIGPHRIESPSTLIKGQHDGLQVALILGYQQDGSVVDGLAHR